jgi:hypothetical protein
MHTLRPAIISLLIGFLLPSFCGASNVLVGDVPFQDGIPMSISEAETFFTNTGDSPHFDDVTIQVRMVSAPNAFGSPSWAQFVENSMQSLILNLGDVGDRYTDPASYHILGNRYEAGDIMVTSFNAWRGYAFPGTPFDGEFGNRLHCGLSAEGDGTIQFNLADVLYMFSSSDHVLDFAGTLDGTTYNGTTRIGLDYGTDRLKGTPDDTWYMSGEVGSTMVDALYYVGVGNAYWPGGGPVPSGTEQSEINATRDQIWGDDVEISCGYFIRGNQTTILMSVDAPFFLDGFESGDTSGWSTTSQ